MTMRLLNKDQRFKEEVGLWIVLWVPLSLWMIVCLLFSIIFYSIVQGLQIIEKYHSYCSEMKIHWAITKQFSSNKKK